MDFNSLKAAAAQFLKDAMPGGALNAEWTPSNVENAKFAAGFTPILGDAISAYDTVKAMKEGNYPEAALSAAGMLPFVPGVTKAAKNIVSGTATPIKQGRTRFFHAGSDPVSGGAWDSVPTGKVFDGFFALEGGYGNYGTGAKYFADVPDSKVLRDYDLNYQIPYQKVKNALNKAYGKKLNDDDLDIAWRAVVEDKSHKVDADDLMRVMRMDSIGEASWEAQRLRGRLAKALGFKAVEMSDENGTSFLLTDGVKLFKDID